MGFSFYIPIFFLCNMLVNSTEAETISANECIRLVRYTENKTVPYSKIIQKRRHEWCFSFRFVCTAYESTTEWTNRTEAVEFTKSVRECCLGYKEENGTCKPTCEKECVHGNCVSPDRCLCDAGWTGIDCTKECDSKHYGHDCDEYCLCQNGATCNRLNGTCHCAPGFTGIYCETTCPLGSIGDNCENICRCKNGATCEVQRERNEHECLCGSGYIGTFCDIKCPEGTYGEGCRNICNCEMNSTEFCNPISGSCNCLPGYKGKKCEEKCEAGFWGFHCKDTCDCGHNPTSNKSKSDCNHITGDCNCLTGWYGPKCTEKCPVGRWGNGCLQECSCSNNSVCDSETGECLCLKGWIGSNCSTPCLMGESMNDTMDEGFNGFYCNFQCDCRNTEVCNDTNSNGTCICSLNGNNIACTTGTLNSTDERETNSTIFSVVAIVFAIFILWIVMIIIQINKSKPKTDSEFEFDEGSTAAGIENQVFPEFSSETEAVIANQALPKSLRQQFANPIYEECEVHVLPSSSRSAAFVTPIRSSLNISESAIHVNCESLKENKLPNASFSSKEKKVDKRLSANAVARYSKSQENPEITDEKSDRVSLYRISIYEETGSPEENHYENPNAL